MSKLKTFERLRFPFEEDNTSPEYFFAAIQNFFLGINTLQKEIIKKADPLYDVKFVLHDISSGSLCADFIKLIIYPDEQSGELNLTDNVGNIEDYSNQIQDALLNKFNTKSESLISNDDILDLSKQINSIAESTGVIKKVNFRKPNVITLVNSVQSFQKVANGLSQNTSYEYQRNNKKINVPRFYLDIDTERLIAESKTNETITSFTTKNLKIKQVDFLGHAKWHFKLDLGQNIEAKILDEAWLENFHAKRIKIGSGDSLMVDGVIKDIKDDSNNIISTNWYITKIHDIL